MFTRRVLRNPDKNLSERACVAVTELLRNRLHIQIAELQHFTRPPNAQFLTVIDSCKARCLSKAPKEGSFFQP